MYFLMKWGDKLDKIVLGFIVDLLFLKGIICFEEFDDIMESKKHPRFR